MIIVVCILVALALGLLAGWWLPPHGRLPGRSRADEPAPTRHILLPFTGTEVSKRALQAAIRLAKAEDATIMPCYLACVPMSMAIDAAVPGRAAEAMPLLEAIEQKVAAAGVRVDARVARGRTFRDALGRVLEREPVDRVIVSASSALPARDVEWMLQRVDAEVMILRPAPEDRRVVSAAAVAGHF